MAIIKSSFVCSICEQIMTMPAGSVAMGDFIFHLLTFYRQHDVCEINKAELEKAKAKFKPVKKKKGKRK